MAKKSKRLKQRRKRLRRSANAVKREELLTRANPQPRPGRRLVSFTARGGMAIEFDFRGAITVPFDPDAADPVGDVGRKVELLLGLGKEGEV